MRACARPISTPRTCCARRSSAHQKGLARTPKDNTPAVIHYEIVPGDTVDVQVAAKGGGSENKSKFVMLEPSDSIVDWVSEDRSDQGRGLVPAGHAGIGIGGTAEKAW